MSKESEDSQFVKTYQDRELDTETRPSPILVGGSEEIGLRKLAPQDIEKYLWMHPVVPRGIEIKANRMIRRGYKITPNGKSRKAIDAAKEMDILFQNSGGLIGLKKWIQDSFGFGTGYRTLVYNKKGNKVLTLMPEHPIYFRIAKYPDNFANRDLRGKMKINTQTKEPESYAQYKYDSIQNKWIQEGPDIPADRVAALYFDTWGDEKQGISVVQYLHLTLKYIMNIEEAGAETMFRNGFIQKKVTTNIKTAKDLKEMAKSLEQINRRDAIILPEGSDVTNLNPGNVQFKEFHDIFLKLLAIRLGIPQPLLTLDGTATNKSTVDSQKEEMHDDFSADEMIIKQTIEDQIFTPACRAMYGKDFNEIPSFDFKKTPENDEKIAEILVMQSNALMNLVNVASTLKELGKETESNMLVDKIRTFLQVDMNEKDKSL